MAFVLDRALVLQQPSGLLDRDLDPHHFRSQPSRFGLVRDFSPQHLPFWFASREFEFALAILIVRKFGLPGVNVTSDEAALNTFEFCLAQRRGLR